MDEENPDYRYGQWAGNNAGNKQSKEHCVKGVYPSHSKYIEVQCSRNRGFGNNGLYCKQHAPKD